MDTNNKDTLLKEYICKSLQVIKSLIVQAKRNSESSTPATELTIANTSDDQTDTNEEPTNIHKKCTNNSNTAKPDDLIADPMRRLDLLNASFTPVIKAQRTVSLNNHVSHFASQMSGPDKTQPVHHAQGASLPDTGNMFSQLEKLIRTDSVDSSPPTNATPNGNNNKTSDYESSESNNSDYGSDTDRLQFKENLHQIKMSKIKEEPTSRTG